MSNRDDFDSLLAGEQPEKMPACGFGFWDEKSMHKLAPPDCVDENILSIPSDDPPRDCFSPEPRTRESRERTVRLGRYLDNTFIGVGC